MAEFERYLSADLKSALCRLAKDSDLNWWKDILASKDLLLAVRGGYLNAYANGQSVLKIGREVDRGEPRLSLHYKYLLRPEIEKGDPYVISDGKNFTAELKHLFHTEYVPGATLQQIKRAANVYAGAEKIGIAKIASNEPRVIDVEIAFSSNGDSKDIRTPRMDLALVMEKAPGKAELVFCEAKCAYNKELWERDKKDKSVVSVVRQIRAYESFVRGEKNRKNLAAAYTSVCGIFAELKKNKWARKIDPIILGIADGSVALSVHSVVYLLVYDFDADQRDGAVKKRLERLWQEGLQNQIIAYGNASGFELNKNIRHKNRAAWR